MTIPRFPLSHDTFQAADSAKYVAVLANQCLDRRLADRVTLQREVAAWQATRNASGREVDWRFTTEDARIKLKHVYPAIHD